MEEMNTIAQNGLKNGMTWNSGCIGEKGFKNREIVKGGIKEKFF